MQGVGFRPFVHALATGLGLTGLVGNDLDGVFAEVEGPAAAVSEFLQEADLVPMLHHMKVPTLVVCGEFDQATPPALNKQIVDKIPGAKYIELPGCGHCPPLEQPEQFLAAIKEFVGL